MRSLIGFFFLLALTPGCDRCFGLRLASPQGELRRIDRGYIRTYGCESFDEVASTDDMIAWCVDHNLGDTIAADVNPPCRPGESPGGCELFWVCE
jgi:hypothetical protein